MWDVAGFGKLHLETTRLMPRQKPYNLNVEMARGRLMKVVQKQEDWNLFDFPKAEKFSQRFREAQVMFAEALGKLDPTSPSPARSASPQAAYRPR